MARILNAICLFSFHSLKSENTAYLLPFNSPPAPVIDNDLPYERYSETVQRLRSLFPPACPSFEPGEVTLDVETPIAAGGFADIWQGTCGGHRVVQKTYRCYETGDAESTFRVSNGYSSRTAWFTFCSRDTSARYGCLHSYIISILSDSSELILPQTTLFLLSLTRATISTSENTSTSTPKSMN